MTPLQQIAFACLIVMVVVLSTMMIPSLGNPDMTPEQLLTTLGGGCITGLIGIRLLYIERKHQTQ